MVMVLPMPCLLPPLTPPTPPPTRTDVRSVPHRGSAQAGAGDAEKEQEPTTVTLSTFALMRASLVIPGPPNLPEPLMSTGVVDLPGTMMDAQAFVYAVRHTFSIFVAAAQLATMTPRATNRALAEGPPSLEEALRDGLRTIRNSRNGKWRSWPEDRWRHWSLSPRRAAQIRAVASSRARGTVSRPQFVTAAAMTYP